MAPLCPREPRTLPCFHGDVSFPLRLLLRDYKFIISHLGLALCLVLPPELGVLAGLCSFVTYWGSWIESGLVTSFSRDQGSVCTEEPGAIGGWCRRFGTPCELHGPEPQIQCLGDDLSCRVTACTGTPGDPGGQGGCCQLAVGPAQGSPWQLHKQR